MQALKSDEYTDSPPSYKVVKRRVGRVPLSYIGELCARKIEDSSGWLSINFGTEWAPLGIPGRGSIRGSIFDMLALPENSFGLCDGTRGGDAEKICEVI